jgi:hypothetical protein
MKKDNNTFLLFIFIFILLVLLYLYQRYQSKLDREHHLDDYTFIQKYLLSDNVEDKLNNCSKPILWIYINYEYK